MDRWPLYREFPQWADWRDVNPDLWQQTETSIGALAVALDSLHGTNPAAVLRALSLVTARYRAKISESAGFDLTPLIENSDLEALANAQAEVRFSHYKRPSGE